MKISKIEYDNFRNFKDPGEIICSTDGKVTIIYGKNGDGKTTLHQLLQWIIYGDVSFNKTANNHLYNLELEKEKKFGDEFKVSGKIEFEHAGTDYYLIRESTYKKQLTESIKVKDDIRMLWKTEENSWAVVDDPKQFIEKMLPSGLSEYFFFDGESMIADLRVKGKESASKLRTALYSMFELDLLEEIIEHIGRTDLKTTVLGKLYLSKGKSTDSSEIATCKTNIANAEAGIEKIDEKLDSIDSQKKDIASKLNSISEQIGSTKSKEQYENERKQLVFFRDQALSNIVDNQHSFGTTMMDMFPKLFISKTVDSAKERLQLKVQKSTLPSGMNKDLITYLTSKHVNQCICGRELGQEQKNYINDYLKMMPPLSYKETYDRFTREAELWGKGYSREAIESWIEKAVNNKETAEKHDAAIKKVDDEQKKSPDIEHLVVERQELEEARDELTEEYGVQISKKRDYERYLHKQRKEYDALTKDSLNGIIVNRQIDIMEKVADYYTNLLDEKSEVFSKRLETNIQQLIDAMLTSKRTVSVSKDFAVRVTDSFDDESKSEGQFAVVSFAYIGGILQMLKSEENLENKEYPLVLDGPFSKLDPDQRQNVVNAITSFAPQVILFSKDSLQDVFKSEDIGRVWTIESNDEKNVASVKEGYLWQ